MLAIVESELIPLLRNALREAVPPQPEFSLYDELRSDLEQYLVERVRAYGQSLWQDLVSVIEQAVLQGEDAQTTLQKLQSRLPTYTGVWLETLYRTELLRYENWASVYEMQRVPEIVAYRYSVVQDDRTSELCKSYAGKVVLKSDLLHIPPLHYNCRTVLIPVLDDERYTPTPPSVLPTPQLPTPPAILMRLKGV